MIRSLYVLFLVLALLSKASAQTILVDGQCINSPVTLNYLMDEAGKPAYQGIGTVAGIANIVVNIYWIGAPDNLWVISFNGQPFFMNSCNTDIPPGSAKAGCSWEPVPGNSCTGASALSVTGAVSLPVRLTQFTASIKNTTVRLDWSTAQEIDNKGFHIQKSADGTQWKSIGFVAGSIYSPMAINYQFADGSPNKGSNFYRLLQEDITGKLTFSPVVKAEFVPSAFFTISGNPGNGLYKLNMNPGTGKLDLSVMDSHGKVIYHHITTIGPWLIDISTYPAGVYWLRLTKDKTVVTERLIKR